AYQSHIRRLQEDLLDAEGELAQRKAVLGEAAPQALNSAINTPATAIVPQDKLNEYSFATSEIEKLKKYDIELTEKFKPMYPRVMNVRSQIDKLTARKTKLE